MQFKPPRHSGTVLIAAIVVALFVAFSRLVGDHGASDIIARTYEIPPSFNGMRILYALTLSFVMPMSLFSASAILENVRFLLSIKDRWHEPVKVSAVNETLILITIFLGITPDVLTLLAWGETSAPANTVLMTLDRVLDMTAALVFFLWFVRRIRSRPVILFQLQREPLSLELTPSWEQLKPKIRVGIVVILLSFGVAFAK